MIQNYNDFINALLETGFSGAIGGKDDGVFSLFRYGWGAEEETGVEWHTGDPDTDPWQWRVRVLEERGDIAYAKVFFRKAGYITKEWYPYFFAARRRGKTLEEEYGDGVVSHFAKRIYQAVEEHGSLPLDLLKRYAGFSREDKPKFDAALNELQMKMYLTISGIKQNYSRDGKIYGWTTTVLDTPERFFDKSCFKKAGSMTASEAADKITERIYKLNSAANSKKIEKFIKG